MISTIINSERAVADIYNSAIAAGSIGAAWEIGLFDEVQKHDKVELDRFCAQQDLHYGSIQGMALSLAVVDVLDREDDNTYSAGRLFDEAYKCKSLFHWQCLGSGGLFSKMHSVVRNGNRHGKYYQRDSVAIAYACKDINEEIFDPIFWQAMKGLNCKFNHVVDLGSGSGERLLQILNAYPGTTALGVDIAGPALAVAAKDSIRRGYGGRISFTEGDATGLDYRPEFEDVDFLTCFMMGHDFWPRADAIDSFIRLKRAFPNCKKFLLGDTPRVAMNTEGRSKYAVTEDKVRVFALGFEFGHQMMGVEIPTTEDWLSVFPEAGWRCVKQHVIEKPYLSVIFELEHA